MAKSVKKDNSQGAGRSTLLGLYAFHFSGFTRVPRNARETVSDPYYVTGSGHLTFEPKGKLSGRQRSTTMAISGPAKHPGQNPGRTLHHSTFALSGAYQLRKDKTGSATISFRRVKKGHNSVETVTKEPEMTDTFEFVLADSNGDRLWFISTDPQMEPDHFPVDELVSAEAVRIKK